MQIRFLGTRGNIRAQNAQHYYYTSTAIVHGGKTVVIDYGTDWAKHGHIKPTAILITHAHSDHITGLHDGADSCPVYATKETWDIIGKYPIRHRHTITPGRAFVVAGISFIAVQIQHSHKVQTVAFRVHIKHLPVVLIAHDVGRLSNLKALNGVSLYVGDGANLSRQIRPRGGAIDEGHASIKEQLDWCGISGIHKAIFTHFGAQIVKGDELKIKKEAIAYGASASVQVAFAHDGSTFNVN